MHKLFAFYECIGRMGLWCLLMGNVFIWFPTMGSIDWPPNSWSNRWTTLSGKYTAYTQIIIILGIFYFAFKFHFAKIHTIFYPFFIHSASRATGMLPERALYIDVKMLATRSVQATKILRNSFNASRYETRTTENDLCLHRSQKRSLNVSPKWYNHRARQTK